MFDTDTLNSYRASQKKYLHFHDFWMFGVFVPSEREDDFAVLLSGLPCCEYSPRHAAENGTYYYLAYQTADVADLLVDSGFHVMGETERRCR